MTREIVGPAGEKEIEVVKEEARDDSQGFVAIPEVFYQGFRAVQGTVPKTLFIMT